MASPSEPGMVRNPQSPGPMRISSICCKQSVPQCLRAVFLQRGARRSCLHPPEQECPSSPHPRMQRADPTEELPKGFPFRTQDCRLGSNVGCQVRRAERLPSPPLTCFSVMA